MKRKSFIKGTVSAATLPLLLNGFSLRTFGQSGGFPTAIDKYMDDYRSLVLIQLDGGNDGLSTVIPLDQYSALSNVRSNVLIPEKKVLALNNTVATGFHPAMDKLKNLYNNNHLTVIQGVGYPDPVFSHFRATDIWNTGSGSDTVLSTGWIGRYLDKKFPDYPGDYPNDCFPDPPALQIGTSLSNVLRAPSVSIGMALNSTSDFYNLILGNSVPETNMPWGKELAFISTTAVQSQQYLTAIKKAAVQKNLSAHYPPAYENPLADQMKIVAQLIGGGLRTQVYVVSLQGFDTHHKQVMPSDHTKGVHARLLQQLSDAIAAFEDDLRLMNKLDQVIGMTYSEFGRRIKSNASDGTDHGSSGPMILFGSKLKGGIIGTNPIIPEKADVSDNLKMQYDFRSVYASILKGWFKMPAAEVDTLVMNKYPVLDLFN